jgi:hypothetical protein
MSSELATGPPGSGAARPNPGIGSLTVKMLSPTAHHLPLGHRVMRYRTVRYELRAGDGDAS